MRHVRRAAIWTLGHKSKKPTWVDAYVDGEYCAQIGLLANSITNCRTSRVWRDPLSTRLDLEWPTDRQTSWNDNKAHSLRTWRNNTKDQSMSAVIIPPYGVWERYQVSCLIVYLFLNFSSFVRSRFSPIGVKFGARRRRVANIPGSSFQILGAITQGRRNCGPQHNTRSTRSRIEGKLCFITFRSKPYLMM